MSAEQNGLSPERTEAAETGQPETPAEVIPAEVSETGPAEPAAEVIPAEAAPAPRKPGRTPPQRPPKSVKHAAVTYYALALGLLVGLGLFIAIYGFHAVVFGVFVGAIAFEVIMGNKHLDAYNKALTAYEKWERNERYRREEEE